MLEYLFFNEIYATRFIQFLKARQLTFKQQVEKVQNATLITTPEDLDVELWNEIDDYYDSLSAEDQLLMQQTLERDEYKMDAAGIYIQLENDRQTIARVDPAIMNRILEVISMDEFNTFIEAVVTSVERPNDGPLCD